MRTLVKLKGELNALNIEISLLEHLINSPQVYSDSKHYLFTYQSIKEGKRIEVLNKIKELQNK
jgi:hypothetical protein